MNILTLGATGRTGKTFTEQALAADHHVTAFVRSPEKVEMTDSQLTVTEGDGLDATAVDTVMKTGPFDAVVILTGGGLIADDTNQRITKNVIQAIHDSGANPRLWILSAAGTGDSDDQVGFFGKLLKKTLLRQPFIDHEKQEEEVRADTIPYTIVRPVGLTDGPLTKTGYVAMETGKLPDMQISRADVAHYILTHLTDPAVEGKAIGLSNKA